MKQERTAICASLCLLLVGAVWGGPWIWDEEKPIATAGAVAQANAPVISLGSNLILTGHYIYPGVRAGESRDGVNFGDYLVETDGEADDGPIFGFTYYGDEFKHAVWPSYSPGEEGDTPIVVHNRGNGEVVENWYAVTCTIAKGWESGSIYELSLATHQKYLYVAFVEEHDEEAGTFFTPICRTNEENGEPAEWAEPHAFNTTEWSCDFPSVAATSVGSDQHVHVCWLQEDELRYDLMYDRSVDHGQNWNGYVSLVEDDVQLGPPCIVMQGEHGYITCLNADGKSIRMLRTTDAGESWSTIADAVRTTLGTDAAYSTPRIAWWYATPTNSRIVLTSKVTVSNVIYLSTRTLADLGGTLVLLREEVVPTAETSSPPGPYSCAGDYEPVTGKRRLRTARVVHGEQGLELRYQGAVYDLDLAPIEVSENRVSGPRRSLTDVASGSIHAVSELDACGTSVVGYRRDPDSPTCGWDLVDAGETPTIGLDATGNPWITYVRADSTGSNETLYAAVRNADTGWTYKPLHGAASGQHLGPPSLAVFQNGSDRIGNVCFPCYDSVTASSMILYCQFDTTDGAWSKVLDTLDYCNGKYSDSSACLTVCANDTISVCYNSGDSVFARRLVYVPNSTCRPSAWSSASLVDPNVTATSYHASCEKIDSRLWVAYTQRTVSGNDTTWAIMRTSCLDTGTTLSWEGTAAMSLNDENRKDYPSISTSAVVAWAESSGTHWVIKASVADSVLTLTSGDTNCKFVSILADTAVQTTPSTSTTGVYYKWLQQYSGDTWAVSYATKQILASDADANVTMYNQGSKQKLDSNDSLHVVYRSLAGSLQYGIKKDGVEGWTSSLLRSTGDQPALDLDYLNRIYVADRDFDNSGGGAGGYDVIRCQTRAAGSGSWTDFQVYSSAKPALSTQHKLSPPAIAACLNDTGDEDRSASYIVYTVYEPGTMTAKSTTCMAKVNTSGVVYIDTLRSVQGHGDSFPSICLSPVAGEGYAIHVSLQVGTEVYVRKTTNLDQPQFTTKRTWSSDYNLSSTGSRSKHPQIAANADTVLASWVEGDSGVIYVKGQGPGSNYNAWGSAVNVSACPDTVCDEPTIAIGDSIIVTYHKKLSATNYDIIARVNFHSNLNLSNSANMSKYPHCVFHVHNDSYPTISTVWTEELSTNYAEVGYKRWQLGEENGGGIQNAGLFDPNIHPALFAPSPNPFTGLTSIRYSTNIKGLTRVTVMDITGRRVRNLLAMPQNPGIYNLTWNAKDDRERQLPRGVYFVRLETSNYKEARKVVLE